MERQGIASSTPNPAIPAIPGQIVTTTDRLASRLDPGKPEEGAELVALVRERLQTEGFAGKSLTDALTVLAEMMTNAIEHGCAGRPDGWVEVEALLARTHVCFRVRNPGPGFDAARALQRSQENLVSPTSLRGRGLALIKLLAVRTTFQEQGCLAEAVVMKSPPEAGETHLEARLVETPSGRGAILKPGDDLNMWGIPSLRSQVDRLLDFRCRLLILQLDGITGADSAGLGFLVGLRKKTQAVGCLLALVGLSPELQQTFQLIHFDQVFSCYPDVDSAMQALQGTSG